MAAPDLAGCSRAAIVAEVAQQANAISAPE
jgi:hypothetical protein